MPFGIHADFGIEQTIQPGAMGLTISPAPPSVPATATIPSKASGDHHCDQHYEDGRIHAALMYAASIFDTPQAWHSKT
jgi:hypothetical protein